MTPIQSIIITSILVNFCFVLAVTLLADWIIQGLIKAYEREIADLKAEIARLKGEPEEPSGDTMRIISTEDLGNHVVRVTTESKRYGRVTQNVLILHESVFDVGTDKSTP